MGAAGRARSYVGIDVQVARRCPYAVLDGDARVIRSGWLPREAGALTRALGELASELPAPAFGIDAPRQPLPAPRRWYWRGAAWHPRRPSEKGAGRHCEVVVKAHGLANPQWTPLRGAAPPWMELGFRIFESLQAHVTHEAFPSASYGMLPPGAAVEMRLAFDDFRPGPRDMLDALAAALTVREFEQGRGQAVGGGDGLGRIVLPRPIEAPIEAVLRWPDAGSPAA